MKLNVTFGALLKACFIFLLNGSVKAGVEDLKVVSPGELIDMFNSINDIDEAIIDNAIGEPPHYFIDSVTTNYGFVPYGEKMQG